MFASRVKMGIKVTKDNTQKLVESLHQLTLLDVMVGVPEKKAAREEGGEINNAELAYIHDNGAPEANIPARPFMKPGIRKARLKIIEHFRKAGEAAVNADAVKVRAELARAGMDAVSSIKKTITEGIPPPITEAAVRSRAYRRGEHSPLAESEKEYIEMIRDGATGGALAESGLVTPLVDTGKLLASIDYELRPRALPRRRS